MTKQYIDTHGIYTSGYTKEQLLLLKNSYYGTGGYVDGSYIAKSPAENKDKYEIRRKSAVVAKWMQLAVDANLNPVINDVERITQSNIINAFLEDCDGFGNSYNDFMTQVAIDADVFGCSIVFIDSYAKQPSSLAEMMNARTFPFVVSVNPLELIDYCLHARGAFEFFVYKMGEDESGDIFVYYENINGQHTLRKCRDVDGNGTIGSIYEMSFKPIIFTFNQYPDRYTLPMSKYYGIAQMQKEYYNQRSLINYQALKTTFSFLTYNGDVSGNLVLGENSILQYPQGSQAPSYIAPPNTMVTIEDSSMEGMKRDAFTEVNLGVLYAGDNVSGESKKWSDLIRQQNLMKKSNILAKFDTKLIENFCSALGIAFDYSATYPSSFESLTMEQDLKEAQDYINLGIAPENEQRIKIRIGQQMFADAPPETKEEISNAELRYDTYPVTDENIIQNESIEE
jgi:hypothetical protein